MTDLSNQKLLEALTRQLGVITDSMVVRKDVEEIVAEAIQKAIIPLATKNELRSLATKEELKSLATKDDITRLERKLDRHHAANIQHHLTVRKGIGNLNRQFGDLREGLAQAAGL